MGSATATPLPSLPLKPCRCSDIGAAPRFGLGHAPLQQETPAFAAAGAIPFHYAAQVFREYAVVGRAPGESVQELQLTVFIRKRLQGPGIPGDDFCPAGHMAEA